MTRDLGRENRRINNPQSLNAMYLQVGTNHAIFVIETDLCGADRVVQRLSIAFNEFDQVIVRDLIGVGITRPEHIRLVTRLRLQVEV